MNQGEASRPPRACGLARESLLALAVTVAATLVVGSTAHAGGPPREIERLARAACRSRAPATWAGPWREGPNTLWAAVVYAEGSSHACLGLVARRSSHVDVVAVGSIPAGASDRYSERYAPTLRAEPLRGPHGILMLVTEAMQMGASGGGGTETTAWVAHRGTWREAFGATLDGATNVNDWVEHPCPSPGELVVVGDSIEADSCFDGEIERRSWRLRLPRPHRM